MTRRQFNLRSIKKIREMEQSQARERLAEFVNPFFPGSDKSDEANQDDHAEIADVDTRHDMKPICGPLSDRLQRTPDRSMESESQSSETQSVVLEDLDGNLIASLPCDDLAGIIIIGRGQNATVRISDPYVHRVHAHMRWDAGVGAHIIVHGGGENATYVNKRKIQAPYTLQDGNRIRLGRTEMIYRIG
ncbi:hypothetical protein BH23CHL2_BH23CHL2_01100 [soil metagenome]